MSNLLLVKKMAHQTPARKTLRRDVKSSPENSAQKYQMDDPKKQHTSSDTFQRFRNVPVITAKLNILLTFFKTQLEYLSSPESLKFSKPEIQAIAKVCLEKDVPILSENVNLLRDYCKNAFHKHPRSGTVKAFDVKEFDKTGPNGEIVRDEQGKILRYTYIGFFSNIRKVPREVYQENDLTLGRSRVHHMLHQILTRFTNVRQRLEKFQSNSNDADVLYFLDETIQHLESMSRDLAPFEELFLDVKRDAPKPATSFTKADVVESVVSSNDVTNEDDDIDEEEPPRPKRRLQQVKVYKPRILQPPKDWENEKRVNSVVVETDCCDTMVVDDSPDIEGVTIPSEDMQPLTLNEVCQPSDVPTGVENSSQEKRFEVLVPVYNCTNDVFIHKFHLLESEYRDFIEKFTESIQLTSLKFNSTGLN